MNNQRCEPYVGGSVTHIYPPPKPPFDCGHGYRPPTPSDDGFASGFLWGVGVTSLAWLCLVITYLEYAK